MIKVVIKPRKVKDEKLFLLISTKTTLSKNVLKRTCKAHYPHAENSSEIIHFSCLSAPTVNYHNTHIPKLPLSTFVIRVRHAYIRSNFFFRPKTRSHKSTVQAEDSTPT